MTSTETAMELTVQYRLPTSQYGTVRLLDVEIARADLPKVNYDWAVALIRAYYDLPEMGVEVLAVGETDDEGAYLDEVEAFVINLAHAAEA